MRVEIHTTVRPNRRLGTLDIDDVFFETRAVVVIQSIELADPCGAPPLLMASPPSENPRSATELCRVNTHLILVHLGGKFLMERPVLGPVGGRISGPPCERPTHNFAKFFQKTPAWLWGKGNEPICLCNDLKYFLHENREL